MLSAFGPTWRLVMDVVHQRSQDLHASNKSTTRNLFMRTWRRSKKRRQLTEQPTLQLQYLKWTTTTTNSSNLKSNSNSQWWWNSIHTTKIWTWISAIRLNSHNFNIVTATCTTTKVCQWTTNHFLPSPRDRHLFQSKLQSTLSSNHSSDRTHEKAHNLYKDIRLIINIRF